MVRVRGGEACGEARRVHERGGAEDEAGEEQRRLDETRRHPEAEAEQVSRHP